MHPPDADSRDRGLLEDKGFFEEKRAKARSGPRNTLSDKKSGEEGVFNPFDAP